MPTYEYTCEKCGKNFDAFQSMRDEPFKVCPKELCRLPKWGKGKVKRLLGTGAGLIFKGSGFYITGVNFEGPAPRPLERAGLRVAEDGMLEVNKSVKYQEEMGQWTDPTSFVSVV